MLKLKIVDKNKEQITNDWTIERVATEWTPSGWEKVFLDAKDEIKDVSDILEKYKEKHGRWYPDNKNLFRAFELCPLNRVKVVIIGQDPYHNLTKCGIPQAMGMSFSVPKGAQIPSSLRNIFKEISTDIPGYVKPTHGDLTRWADQGILLLNSCLTVKPKEPGSHKEVWLGFVKKVIMAILETNKDCIFVLWGRKAQKISKMLGQRTTILEAAHPSGFSCHKGFFGCKHFSEINKLLKDKGKKEIKW